MRMGFDIKLNGMDIAKNRTIAQQKKVLWLSMHKMKQLAKQYAPVNTGLLRRSINLHPRRVTPIIKNNIKNCIAFCLRAIGFTRANL